KKLDPVKVSGVKISPDPVVSGEAATFKISGSTDKDISGGEVVISVSYFGIHGTYTLKMTIKDNNGGRLTCISFKFKITLDSTVSVS
ncbi:unnamed protein product, partial [Thlaspi arvense]